MNKIPDWFFLSLSALKTKHDARMFFIDAKKHALPDKALDMISQRAAQLPERSNP